MANANKCSYRHAFHVVKEPTEFHHNSCGGFCNQNLSGFPLIESQQPHTESPLIRPQSTQVHLPVNTVGHADSVNNNSISIWEHFSESTSETGKTVARKWSARENAGLQREQWRSSRQSEASRANCKQQTNCKQQSKVYLKSRATAAFCFCCTVSAGGGEMLCHSSS